LEVGGLADETELTEARPLHVLQDQIVQAELSGVYTSHEQLTTYLGLGGTEAELDEAVRAEAAVRRAELSPAGLAVVWSRLLPASESLSEDEIRSWLEVDMIRALAAKAVTWSRFSSVVLRDWTGKDAVTPTENTLIEHLLARHPRQSAALLAQVMRDTPSSASRLTQRLEAASPATLSGLAGAIVDDHTIPAGLRIMLASRAGEEVRAQARDMVARELGVTNATLASLAPDGVPDDEPDPGRDEGATPAAMRLAWLWAGIAFFTGTLLSLRLNLAFMIAVVMCLLAWMIGRERED
jgi:hypothetical protein